MLYLIETKPYEDKLVCFSMIINEILIFIFYIMLFLPFLSGLGYDKTEMSTHTIIFVLCALLFNILICLIAAFKNIKEIIVIRISRRRNNIRIHVVSIDGSQQELH